MADRHHDVPDLRAHFRDFLEPPDANDSSNDRTIATHRGQQTKSHPFRLGDEELATIDSWVSEHAKLSGTEIQFYTLDLENSTQDPLYGEFVDRVYKGPFLLWGVFGFPTFISEPREAGALRNWNLSAWIPRIEVERVGARHPRENDVIRVWDVPIFNEIAAFDEDRDSSGYFFDLTQVDPTGHLFDGPAFTGFDCELQRRTDLSPEEKLFEEPC